jgi:hypothetical protein
MCQMLQRSHGVTWGSVISVMASSIFSNDYHWSAIFLSMVRASAPAKEGNGRQRRRLPGIFEPPWRVFAGSF